MRLTVSLKVAISMYIHTSINYILTVSKQCPNMPLPRSMEIGIAVGVTVFLMIVAAITVVVTVVLCYCR